MSSKITAAITAVGGYVPEYRLTNAELEKMVDTSDEWIRTRTGVTERRILKGKGLGTSDMIVPAVKELLEKRKIGAEEIDCLIVGTVTPDTIFPSTANIACCRREPEDDAASARHETGRGCWRCCRDRALF